MRVGVMDGVVDKLEGVVDIYGSEGEIWKLW